MIKVPDNCIEKVLRELIKKMHKQQELVEPSPALDNLNKEKLQAIFKDH